MQYVTMKIMTRSFLLHWENTGWDCSMNRILSEKKDPCIAGLSGGSGQVTTHGKIDRILENSKCYSQSHPFRLCSACWNGNQSAALSSTVRVVYGVDKCIIYAMPECVAKDIDRHNRGYTSSKSDNRSWSCIESGTVVVYCGT